MIDAALADVDAGAEGASREIQKRIEEYAVECSILKVWASEMLDMVVDHVMQIYAGYGYVLDAGLEQIKAGLAWHYKQYQKDQAPDERLQYAVSERDARARGEGLWKDPDPVPPWEFRSASIASRHTGGGE